MPPALQALLTRAIETWNLLSSRARMALAGGLGVALVVSLGIWAVTTFLVDYQILFANLAPDDAATVAESLRAGKVPFRMGENGQILVPAARVHEWRLKLASQGVPSGGGVGFEIFDKNQFGLTDFAQRLNFQRALQGELARTIGQLREVQQARVHLALPAPRVFSSQDKPASASVVLRLRPGTQLRPDQVRGIVHLVTASVEGLTPDRVTVVDSTGRMLMSGLDRIGGLSANQQEARGLVEHEIERRVQTLLDPIVGPGRSAVRIAALVNFDQIERTEERFDPKTLVRTQTKSTENLQGASSQPMTTPGAAPKTEQAREASASTRTVRENEQTTYEIARTVEKTVVAPGEVRRMSIAVLLDVPVVNGVRTPRTDEDIERIKRLVASAAGIRADRKDELEIAQVSFDPSVGLDTAPGRETAKPAYRWSWTYAWIGGAVLAVLALASLFWRARRRRLALANAVGAAYGGANVLPAAAGAALERAEVEFDLTAVAEDTTLKRQVLKVAKEHPDEMAQLLRAWMFRRRTMVQ